MTTDARAHVSRTPRPGCVACGGLGTIHQQVPGELRVIRVPCPCKAEHVAKAQEKRA
jgi:hypothetical protein